EALRASHILVATGARPRPLPGFEVDNEQIWDYRGALMPTRLPASLLVIGGGAIGMEFACFYAALGTAITLVESQERLLPLEDNDVSQAMAGSFRSRGIDVCTGSRATFVKRSADAVTVRIESDAGDSREQSFENVLVCAGVVGNIEDMGLENTRAQVTDGFIRTGASGRTAEDGLYAVGDVAGPPMLAHKASFDALRCVESMAGQEPESLMRHSIPSGIYTEPQVASIGLTEAQARSEHDEVAVGMFPLAANGKAVATQATAGFIKTVFDKRSGELLGAHLVGHNATELLPSLSVAQQLETTEAELLTHMFPHPTLAEAIGESVMAAFGRALHI
ncbi:MAG TPA: FAD-dependent oxidoreductase, partial [Burkholderiaceae bacterium]|nr:FAD-dependent oxidoreductase [Burkholderiaceae bacterium]